MSECVKIMMMETPRDIDSCSFCQVTEEEAGVLFIAPSGATMCEKCLKLIKKEMAK